MDDPMIIDPETGLPGYVFLTGDEAGLLASMASDYGDPEDDDKPSEQQESDELEEDYPDEDEDGDEDEDDEPAKVEQPAEVDKPGEPAEAEVPEGEGGEPKPEEPA